MKQPMKKRLWQQIIRAKLQRQAENLPTEYPAHDRLQQMALEVRSGDPQNLEACGAKLYWQNWLWQEEFCRDRNEAGINSLLNYGYSIIRAAIARAIVAAGLHPSIGVFHRNRSNAFCLADDLIEPFRPWVDDRVRDLFIEGHTEINTHSKQELLELLVTPLELEGQQGPAMTMFHRYVASLVRCMDGTSTHLSIPKPC
jgi:CRISPR-associated protein Cas1